MEIENYLAFDYGLIEKMIDQGVEPECNLIKLCSMLDNNFGTDLIGRADKIVEEAKELAFEASMVDKFTCMTNGRSKADYHALNYIWEFSDLFVLVMQMARLLSKATDCSMNDFCQMMVGASIRKVEVRKTNPEFLHDQDESNE